jgi:uncharacterized iron-regulated membrane protein
MVVPLPRQAWSIMILGAGAAIAVFAAAGLWVWRDRNHAGKPPSEVRRVQALVFALFEATSLIPSGSGDN